MEIEGTYTLQAPAAEVWHSFMDQQTIEHTLPGLERLTRVDDQAYTFALTIRHAPLRGKYTGRASLLEASYPTAYRLKIDGEGQTSTFQGELAIHFHPHGSNTVVSYDGTLQPGHGNKLIPAPLVKATMKVLLEQFFTALADRLRTSGGNLTYVETLEEMYEMPFTEELIGEQLPETRETRPPTLLHTLVHRTGLGRHDPAREEQWVRRLRGIWMVAVLVLLVWVGTRLPRRTALAARAGSAKRTNEI